MVFWGDEVCRTDTYSLQVSHLQRSIPPHSSALTALLRKQIRTALLGVALSELILSVGCWLSSHFSNLFIK